MTTKIGRGDDVAEIADKTDIIIIGGGPAGSTAASYLARSGWSVTVFERAVMPRDHVGESLLPFCYGIFEELGVLDEMIRRFTRKPGVRFLDIDGETNTTYCFPHKIDGPEALSFHVLRADFDKLLLDNSVKEGASVHEGVSVRDVDVDGPGDTVVVKVEDADGDEHQVTARFVIDASGRDTFLANRMKTKTAHKELERTALSSHWRDVVYTGGLREGVIQICYTGGEKQGWIWVIPISLDRVSIGTVMNTSYYLDRRRELKDEFGDDWQRQLYLRELDESPFVRSILDGADNAWPIMYNGDYSYVCNQKWGDRFALVGDASAFIDPIFSSGVYLAMESARRLSGSVDERLRLGVDESEATMKGVYAQIVGAYDLVDKLIRLFYKPDALNFAQFGSAVETFEEYEHYENSMSLQHFLLAGDFFEQSHRYSEFVDVLRDERKFDMYKNLVIDRDSFQADSTCEVGEEIAFPASQIEVEKEWNRLGI